jgi:integrase
MARLTKKFLDSLEPDPDKELWFWDDRLTGYGFRLKRSGAGAYLIQYRLGGRTRRHTFARFRTVTPDEALVEARRLLAEVKSGAGHITRDRQEVTVGALCDQYLAACASGLVLTKRKVPKRQSTISADVGRIRLLMPLIGHARARDLSRGQVQHAVEAIAVDRVMDASGTKVMRGGRGASARAVELFSGIWSWAQRRELVSDGISPFRGIELYRGAPRDRTLSPVELARLGVVLRAAAEGGSAGAREAADLITLLVMTGLRRNEGAKLRFSEVDWGGHCLRLETSKTGKSVRPIGKAPLRLLENLAAARDGEEQVFRSAPSYLKIMVARLFDQAGLQDARSHDLRRSYASVAADIGFSDGVIGELLGHSRKGVTAQHYIRRVDSTLVAAADRISDAITAMLDGESGDVLSFTRIIR